ncbi:CRISPR-associated helicase Cas3' [Pontibacter sp. E15-1]|uniref:CRISPR-associated helicase Cas3' n=1 Tax=Pontibacter sp. E15-1 TaxID=2919918 RepID=UPI001F4F807C|nr:CRISPR-associated helicase Cas3' [Pontibacter sp. E15-1]MCJ8165892.1 CRISPR-associated helicase Cas3' [Pontibacter sp. E15-1]
MTLLAKSPEQGGLTLHDHTRQVTDAIVLFANAYGMPADLAEKGALLHDLGKAHPYFQRVLKGEINQDEALRSIPHRHELSSLLFLPLFNREDWEPLVEMVVAHHKSVEEDARSRGLLDLLNQYGPDKVFLRHAEDFEVWQQSLKEVLTSTAVAFRTITLEEAREAFNFAIAYAESIPLGWSKWRGLLMAADHFASEFMAEAAGLAANFFKTPDLSFYNRSHPLYPLSLIPSDTEKRHTLVIAPTGAGKTDFLLKRCQGRVVYTLPFQASINAMYQRISQDLNQGKTEEQKEDVRRVHAASRISLKKKDGKLVTEEQYLQRQAGAGVKVTTPHQLLSLIFHISGYEALSLDLQGCDIILDEVHVYNGQVRTMTLKLIERLAEIGCRIHIGTATIADSLVQHILAALGGAEKVQQVRLHEGELQKFNRHEVYKASDETTGREIVSQALAANERVLFVANRVKLAQERYLWAMDEFPDISVLLVHSRYRRCDRAALESEIYRYNEMQGPCLVIATQVVEVSLDISFDRMVTDAAPLDALVQRFGRVHRKRTEATIGTYRPVHVIVPSEEDKDLLPYEPDIVRRSFDALPNGLLEENELQRLINSVYGDVPLPSVDVHTAPLPMLCHRPKSVLLEALEIESAVCVREEDKEKYLKSRGNERQTLEIPVPWKSLMGQMSQISPLEVGSYPYIIPDEWYNSSGHAIGLTIPKSNAVPAAQPTQML